MNDRLQQTELLQGYLQCDVPARAERFGEFVAALQSLARLEGPASAAAWAARAVGPQVDYSSLLKLRRFLVPTAGGQAAAGKPAPLRLAILGGPTTVQLRQLIEVFLVAEAIAVEIFEGEYGLFRQELLQPSPELVAFAPQMVFIATGVRDIARLPALSADAAEVERLAAQEVESWLALWELAHSRWNATILQNNCEIVPGGALGHYGLRHPAAAENYALRLNRLLAEAAPPYVLLHDLCGLAAEAGARTWFDPRFYLEFKMPCAGVPGHLCP